MSNFRLEPGLISTFRYFTAVAMGYFTLLMMLALLSPVGQGGGGITGGIAVQMYVNLGCSIFTFAWLSSRWLERKLGRVYLPLALAGSTVAPLLSNLVYLQERNLALVIERSWLLFPILVVPLAVIAWQYRFRAALVFTIFTAIVEISVLLPFIQDFSLQSLGVVGVPLVRAFAFGTLGHMISNLVTVQQAQQDELKNSAGALARANLYLRRYARTQEELVLSRERNRLARELHDTLAHTLSSQAVTLEAVQLMLPPGENSVPMQTMLEQSLKDVRSGLTETRRALRDLRAQSLEDLGLVIGLQNLAADAAQRAQFDLDLRISAELPEISPDLEQCIYRIAQEALENIVRHAEAQHVRVELKAAGTRLSLTIQDDGRGFDISTQDGEDHFGLQGMREWAVSAGGSLGMNSVPNDGTLICLEVDANHDSYPVM